MLSQATFHDPRYASDGKYVENVMWEQSRVLFVAINLPGGSNNDQDAWFGADTETAEQTTERTERTAADLRWLDAAFFVAKLTGAKAVVIQAQADMWDPEKGAEHQAGYEPFVQSVASHTLAFGKPVLMLNGDSHEYQVGNPLVMDNPIHPGYEVPSFYRIVVHGSTFPLQWLKLTIDPRADAPAGDTAFGPFSWEVVTP